MTRRLVVLCCASSCLLGGCSRHRDDGIFDDFIETRRRGEAFTDALQLEGGVVVSGDLPEVWSDGPVMDSIRLPAELQVDTPYTFRVAVRRGDESRAQTLALQFEAARDHLEVPLAMDGTTGHAMVTARLLDDHLLIEHNTVVELALLDDRGRSGPRCLVELDVRPVTQTPAFDETHLFAHVGATLALSAWPAGGEVRIASGGKDHAVGLWSADTGHLLRWFRGHTGAVLWVAASPDASLLASGGQDHTVRLWDAHTGDLIGTHGHHLDEVTSVAFSPEGRLLVSGSWDGEVHVQTLDGSPVGDPFQRVDIEAPVNALLFSPAGDRLAVGTGWLLHQGRLQVWSTDDWSLLQEWTQEREVTALAFSSAGDRLAAAVGRGRIVVYDVATGDRLHLLQDGPQDTVPVMSFWPGNDDLLGTTTLSGFASIWQLSNESLLNATRIQTGITAGAFSSDGSLLIFGDSLGQIHVQPNFDPLAI